MFAEVISIGDELTSGQRLDTNSRWLSQQLGDLGIKTIRHTTVCDDLHGNVEAFRLAAGRADLVLATGGLGPTLDDLTRQAIATAFGRELVLDEESLEFIRGLFSRRLRGRSPNSQGQVSEPLREMPERNRLQAMFPEGSLVIPNPHGSAPGIDFSVTSDVPGASARIFALPGVPAEMREMWQQTVVARIQAMLGNELGPLRYHTIKMFGIGESDVEVKLPDLIHRDRIPTVGITVSQATITLRIAGRAQTEAEFQQIIEPTIAEIRAAMGDLIFGEGDDELQQAVLRELPRSGKSLATVEIGAASFVADWLLAETTQNACGYLGGVALPNLDAAGRWLGIEIAEGTSPAEHLGLLAQAARERFASDLLLLVCRYPSFAEMNATQDAFDLQWVLADGPQVDIREKSMGGHPDVLAARIGKTGLDFVRRRLLGLA